MDVKKIIGDALTDLVDSAKTGGPRVPVGLMARGSEHGPKELAEGGRLAQSQFPRLKVVMIGPKLQGYDDLEWIETEDCDASVAKAMEKALLEHVIKGAVALHYPFPMGVTTIGRVFTPGKGRDMIIASSTGTSAINRVEAMIKNALYGIAAAKALGKAHPTVGILNVEGAQLVFRALSKLKDKGYSITFGESQRADGGSVLRGNDILSGVVDVCVCDTLTGNVLMKMFSSFNTGGSYEATGWGYGPSAGEGWEKVISIISRASGAPVIANALAYNAKACMGDLPSLVKSEIERAKKAGLEEVIQSVLPKPEVSQEDITPPPAEPTDHEIHGIDVLSVEDAVKELWKNKIYAESSMGCTGPVVKLPKKYLDQAMDILKKAGYL